MGRQIGAGNKSKAQKYFKATMSLSSILCFIQTTAIYFSSGPLMRLFTNSKELQMMAEALWLPFAIVTAQDFFQGCIYGTVKALELQK